MASPGHVTHVTLADYFFFDISLPVPSYVTYAFYTTLLSCALIKMPKEKKNVISEIAITFCNFIFVLTLGIEFRFSG